MFDYKPVFGMFDGPPYRFVGDVVARNAPLDEIVSLATDIL